MIFIIKNNIMKKVIRLTESDLMRIVKRVLKESDRDMSEYQNCMKNVPDGIKKIINLLWASTNQLNTSSLSDWDETGVVKSLLLINSKEQYNQLNKHLECFFNVDSHEPWGSMDFIKYIIDSSLLDYLDLNNLKIVTEHFVKKKIIDLNSEYCKDNNYTDIGNESYPGIGFFCSGKRM